MYPYFKMQTNIGKFSFQTIWSQFVDASKNWINTNGYDKKYGSFTTPIGRMGLHARILAFIHPMTLEEVSFETPVPRNFLTLFH